MTQQVIGPVPIHIGSIEGAVTAPAECVGAMLDTVPIGALEVSVDGTATIPRSGGVWATAVILGECAANMARVLARSRFRHLVFC